MVLEELVNKHYQELNTTDIHIWNYVLNHSEQCGVMSIDDLSDRCNVSRTTITRFTRKLGLNGYSEFKVYLRMNAQKAYNGTNAIKRVYQNYYQLFDHMLHRNCEELFQRINASENLYLFGTGAIQKNIANEFQLVFMNTHKLFYQVEGYDEIGVLSDIISFKDVFIIISLSGESRELHDMLIKIRLQNPYIVSLTATKDNYLSQLSDESFCIPSMHVHGVDSEKDYKPMAGFYFLIEILYMKYLQYQIENGELQ